MPEFVPRASVHVAVLAEAHDLIAKWAVSLGQFATAVSEKVAAETKFPEPRPWGISLAQVPVAELERDVDACEPRGHTHFVEYIHWDKPREGLGRRVKLVDGPDIKYAQPCTKEHFDMASINLYIPDTGA